MLFTGSKKKVLVADDDEDFVNAMRSVLEFEGFNVDTAEDGKEALKQIKRHKYDLLILDVIMPKIDGIKLFRVVRKSKRHREAPVLFISGHSRAESLAGQHQEIIDKADGYIEKPFKTRALLGRVKTLIGNGGRGK